MPSTYAHYRFGVQMLSGMPGDVRRTVQRFRQLFDMGLHGPDIFFFSSPLLPGGARTLGSKFHSQTGEEFFTRVCRGLRLEPSEAADAYLYGLLCHYCLDSVCHPYIRETADRGEVTHHRLETEFERLLLEKDGKVPACSQDLSQHIRLTSGECDTVARFYPGVTRNTVRESVASMGFYVKLLAAPEGMRRSLLRKGMGVMGKRLPDFLMEEKPNTLCQPYLPGLTECWEKAAENFPEMLSVLQAHMTYGADLGEDFREKFDDIPQK